MSSDYWEGKKISTTINGEYPTFECIRCGAKYHNPRLFEPCRECVPEASVNLVPYCKYSDLAQGADWIDEKACGMWRYHNVLASGGSEWITLGEGMTPLIPCPAIGIELGLPNLLIKDESRNPTGSFKARLASGAISVGKGMGARVAVCSSTGNQGLATAAYAARAGIFSVVLMTSSSPPNMKALVRSYGGMVVLTARKETRWRLMREAIARWGWYPVSNFAEPLVGSNPFGVDAYKTIGLEICEQLGWTAPDVVAVPSAFGEGLWGAWNGCVVAKQLGLIESLPRMVAAEVFGPIANALQKGLSSIEVVPTGYTSAYSVGSNTSTYQGFEAVRRSNGTAGVANDEQLLEMQSLLAEKEGILAEIASVLPLVVLRQLRASGWVDSDCIVVAVLTSAGIKDPTLISGALAYPELDESNVISLEDALYKFYGFRQ